MVVLMDVEYITVSEITEYIVDLFDDDSRLNKVFIKGEISNVRFSRKKHMYFTLKDEESQIDCVVFSPRYKLRFRPKGGMKVLIEGRIGVYKSTGRYQLYVDKMSEYGVGDLHRKFEELKKKLKKEGLFDESHKKKIPNFPKRIGVVTADTGAAIRDIFTTIERRWPLCEVILFPSLVQGIDASRDIVRQIQRSDNFNLDTLIVGRGGGSIEDLWAFNEEIVARAIYECKTPVISAVGHEIDFTIADFVADLRAPTPTAAAEFAVPQFGEIRNGVDQLNSRANFAISKKLNENISKFENIISKKLFKYPREIYAPKEMQLDNLISRLEHFSEALIMKNQNRLDLVKNSLVFKNPEGIIDSREVEFNVLVGRLEHSSEALIMKNRNRLNLVKNSKILKNPNEVINKQKEKYLLQVSKLELLNPLNTLKRGYTLAKSEGKVISSSKDLKSGDELEVEFNDGNVNTRVI